MMTNDTARAGLPAYLDKLRERMGVNLVTLSAIEADRQRIIAASRPVGISLVSTDIPLSESICRHVHRMNFPLIVTDVLSHPLLQNERGLRDSLSGAYLGYPVRGLDGRVIAVLAAMRDRIHDWDREQQSLMAGAALDVRRFLAD